MASCRFFRKNQPSIDEMWASTSRSGPNSFSRGLHYKNMFDIGSSGEGLPDIIKGVEQSLDNLIKRRGTSRPAIVVVSYAGQDISSDRMVSFTAVGFSRRGLVQPMPCWRMGSTHISLRSTSWWSWVHGPTLGTSSSLCHGTGGATASTQTMTAKWSAKRRSLRERRRCYFIGE